jgi:hypothetical protein
MRMAVDSGSVRKADDEKFIALEELDKLPKGITVTHEPEAALATLSGPSERPFKYTWWYKTTVSAIDAQVTIVQFGGFKWVDGKWLANSITGQSYTNEDFANFYKCPRGLLKPGEKYTDPTNWTKDKELLGGKTRWYFIGVDSNGKRVKGEAVIELKAEIEP